MLEFDPPRDSPVLIALMQLLWPLVMRIRHGDMKVTVVGDGLSRFKQLKGRRAIICPNHVTDDDSDVVFSLSCAVKESFNFLTAWEILHGGIGRRRWLQCMGCLSVVRDAPDVTSFKASRDLLVKGKKKIIIFPEGELSRENDLLLPIKPGAVQIGFSALEKLEHMDDLDSIFIVPVALKYVYRRDIHQRLQKAVERLEQHLPIRSESQKPLYDRIYLIGIEILSALEEEYNHQPEPGANVNERIDSLREAVLKQAAAWLQVDLPAKSTQLERAHLLLNALNAISYGSKPPRRTFLKTLHQQQKQRRHALLRDIHRVLTFIAISDEYVKEPATQEQLAEIVDMFEEEVFGCRSRKGPRSALIYIGEPIDLLDSFSDYKKDKAATVRGVTKLIAHQLSKMLQSIDSTRCPVFESRFARAPAQAGGETQSYGLLLSANGQQLPLGKTLNK